MWSNRSVMQTWLEAQRAYEHIPAVSAALVKDQQVIWSGGYGYADVERKVPATASTIYSICSISKLFTSVAVMQLRDAGKLRLDDPVAKHLSWFNIKRTFPEREEITIEGLMTHASGLPRESDYPYWTGFRLPLPHARANRGEDWAARNLVSCRAIFSVLESRDVPRW